VYTANDWNALLEEPSSQGPSSQGPSGQFPVHLCQDPLAAEGILRPPVMNKAGMGRMLLNASFERSTDTQDRKELVKLDESENADQELSEKAEPAAPGGWTAGIPVMLLMLAPLLII